ncbi:hypothetical protein FUT87_21055 [Mitsuaria sp. TWR114]|nr:hypothetical protein [Mitsuaria sp. TWR114]TXD79114.1 hypothetical protein FUT87_21055 [Mitsuaria sp. TWR114]
MISRAASALTQRNLYILPSRPGAAFVVTLLVLLLASINDQLSLGYLLTFVLAGAGMASMNATHANLRGLKLDLKTPPPTYAGQPLALDIRLHNPSAARFGVGVRLPDARSTDSAFADVPAQGHAQLQLQLSFPTRGRHALPRLRIESQFPFGLFVTWSYWRPAAQAWVVSGARAGSAARRRRRGRPAAGPGPARAGRRSGAAALPAWRLAAADPVEEVGAGAGPAAAPRRQRRRRGPARARAPGQPRQRAVAGPGGDARPAL